MKQSLEEYAAAHSIPEPEEEKAAREQQAKQIRQAEQLKEDTEALKESIAAQLEQGNEPQYILYAAVKCIGSLTHDPEWTQSNLQILDTVYDDLRQHSFLVDNAAVATKRLEDMQATYNDKLKKQLQTQINGYNRIARALKEALQAVTDIDDDFLK